MLLFPRNGSQRLCSLTLACAMLATPVFAAEQTNPNTDKLIPNFQPAYTSYQESVRAHYTQELALAGYSYDETVFLLDTLPSYRLPVLLRYSYAPTNVEYVSQSHFTDTKLDRYLSYGSEHTDLTPAEVVTQVNIGLDRAFYTSVQMAKEPESLTVLVNKYNYLSSKFVPQLVSMGSRYTAYSGSSMHPEAYTWFTKMVDDAETAGLWLRSVSAYRSYSYQNTLYTRYVTNNGKKLADTFSARAGYSEHQTGLAVDINVASSSAHFENTPHYRWLSEHAWKYGFILRYPQNKEHITGFRFEPWHYRYVGLDAAKAIHDSGLTWEEYLMGPPTVTEVPPSPDASIDIPAELPAPEASEGINTDTDSSAQLSADKTLSTEEERANLPAESGEQPPANETLSTEEEQADLPTESGEQIPANETLSTKEEQTDLPAESGKQTPANETLNTEEEQVSLPAESDEQSPADQTLSTEETQTIRPSKIGTRYTHPHTVSGLYPAWPGVSIPR